MLARNEPGIFKDKLEQDELFQSLPLLYTPLSTNSIPKCRRNNELHELSWKVMQHHSLLLTASKRNLTSFNCLPVGFHASNMLSKSSTSLPNSFFTKSSSSRPRIAHGRKNGLGFVLLVLGSYSFTLSLYRSLSFGSIFSPITGMLMPWKLPLVLGRCCGGMGSEVVSSACWTARA